MVESEVDLAMGKSAKRKAIELKEKVMNVKGKVEDSRKDKMRRKYDREIIVQKPSVDMVILRVNKNIFFNQVEVFPIIYVEDGSVSVYNTDKDIDPEFQFKDLDVLGVEIDHASVYGKTCKVAFLEQSNWLWENIESGDIIIINTYLKHQAAKKLSLHDFLDTGGRVSTNFFELQKAITKYKDNLDFVGFITTKTKDIKATEQFRIQGLDIIRILQQINVPVGTQIRNEIMYSNVLTDVFLDSFIQRLATKKHNFAGEAIETINNITEGSGSFNTKDIFYIDASQELAEQSDLAFSIITKPKILPAFYSCYLYKIYQNKKDDIAIYSLYISTIKIAQFITEYILEGMGVTDFADITMMLTDEFMVNYGYLFGNDKKDEQPFPQSYVNINLYFANFAGGKEAVDIGTLADEDFLDPQVLKEHLICYTFGEVFDFSVLPYDLELDEDGNYSEEVISLIKDKIYFPLTSVDPEDQLANLFTFMQQFKDFRIDEDTEFIDLDRFGKNAEIINSLKTNNFFEMANTNRVAIRSNKYVNDTNSDESNDSVSGTQIPVTQLLTYALSLFVFKPRYYNPFKPFKREIKNIDSNGFMYSLSQLTWFDSILMPSPLTQKPQFVVFPTMTPVLKQKAFKKNFEIFKSQCLEMQFNQLNINDNILQIKNDFPEGDKASLEVGGERFDLKPMIYFDQASYTAGQGGSNPLADLDINVPNFMSQINTRVSMFGNNIIDINNSYHKRAIVSNENAYIRPLRNFYNDRDNYLEDYAPKYTHVWTKQDNDGFIKFEFYAGSGEPNIKKSEVRVVRDKKEAIEVSETTEVRDWLPLEDMHVDGLDGTTGIYDILVPKGKNASTYNIVGINDYYQLDKLGIVMPAYVLKDKIDNSKVDVFNKNNSPYDKGFNAAKKQYKSRYRINISFPKIRYQANKVGADDYIGGTKRGDSVKEIPFHIAGVEEKYDLDKIEKDIENVLFYFNGLPDDIRQGVKILWKKYNVKFDDLDEIDDVISDFITQDLGAITREDEYEIMDMDEIADYCRDIIKKIKDLTNQGLNVGKGIEIIPSTYYLYPDIYTILNEAVNQKAYKADSPFDIPGIIDMKLGKNADVRKFMNDLFRDLYIIIKNPVRITPYNFQTIQIPKVYNQLKAINFEGGITLDLQENKTMEIVASQTLIREIFTLSYLLDNFVQDVMRKNTNGGSVYVANRGRRKFRVGQYTRLMNDVKDPVVNLSRFDPANSLTKKILTSIAENTAAAATGGATNVALGVKEKLENEGINLDFEMQTKVNAIYSDSLNEYDDLKSYGWFIWKTVTYMGNASGDMAGTSGYNQKVYLARDGVRFGGIIEESNFISDLGRALNTNKFNFGMYNTLD